jgi:hypothetical protein
VAGVQVEMRWAVEQEAQAAGLALVRLQVVAA